MKKTLSFLLCMSLLISTFAFAPIVGAQSEHDLVIDFEDYNVGAKPTGLKLTNSIEGDGVAVSADKTVILTAKSSDPFYTQQVTLVAGIYDTAIFTLRWDGVTGGVHPQLFFNRAGEGWNAGRQIGAVSNPSFSVDTTEEFVNATFNLANHALWTGDITSVRFDPADKMGEYELKSITFVNNGNVAASFNGNGGVGAINSIVAAIGGSIVLPENTFTRLGSDFIGWSADDGVTVFQPGDSITLDSSVTVKAIWEERTTEPIIGKNWEFEDDDEGWTATQKLTVSHNEGKLVLTATHPSERDARISSPANLDMSPEFYIAKILYKTTVTSGAGVFGSGDLFYAQGDDGISGGRKKSFKVSASADFQEITVDMSTADGAWFNSNINRLWMDIVRAPIGAVTEIEYIRFHRVGTHQLVYNANADDDEVTGMPANDNIVPKGVGYLLSGKVPHRYGYKFIGWSLTPNGEVVQSVDITETRTDVYAQWETVEERTLTFTKGTASGVTGDDPAPISEVVGEPVVLPASPYTREGHEFAGWYDGSDMYAAGDSYIVPQDGATFTTVWQLSQEQKDQIVFTPENGANILDNRNLFVKVQYPVDLNPNTVSFDKFVSASLHTARVEDGDSIGFYFISDLGETRTITTASGMSVLSSDNTLVMPALNYSISVAANLPDDGENLISNGDFELPFFPIWDKAYRAHLSFTDDTPTGEGTALYVKGVSPYTLTRFPVTIEPDTNYFFSYDAKVMKNQTGESVTTNVYPALKITTGADKPINISGAETLKTNTEKGEGWKHFEGFFYDSSGYKDYEFLSGNLYLQIYANPKGEPASGVDYLLDNVSFQKAYEVTLDPGTIEGVTIIGESGSLYGVKGGIVELENPGLLAPGYILAGWTDGIYEYDLEDEYIVPQGGATLTAIWEESPEFEISFVGGENASGQGPTSIYSQAGIDVELPENTFTREGYSFKGWSIDKGVTVYEAGETFLMLDENVEFEAIWRKDSAISHAAEFNDGTYSGWNFNTSFVKKQVRDGFVDLETIAKDSRASATFTNVHNTDGKEPLDSEYSMFRVRFKRLSEGSTFILRWQRVGDDPGSNDVVTAQNAGRTTNSKPLTGGLDEWVEMTFDLSTIAGWNGFIRALWLDPIEYSDATAQDTGKIQIDYIRFYRKGDFTVTYNPNSNALFEYEGNAVEVTNVPAPETEMGEGTGYILSSQVPVAASEDYLFLGWSLTPTDVDSVAALQPYVLSANQMNLTESTTVYAVWAEIPTELTASFVAGDDNATGSVDPVSGTFEDGKATITLPENSFVLDGRFFKGWKDSFGTFFYPGEEVVITFNETFTAVWLDASMLISYDLGDGATSTTVLPVVEGVAGQKITLISVDSHGLSKPGYVFAGWECEGVVYSGSSNLLVMPDHSIVITARWNPSPTEVPAFGEDVFGGPYDLQDGYFELVPSAGSLEVVDDPVNPENKVLKYEKLSNYASFAKIVKLEGGRRYFVSHKVYIDPNATLKPDVQVNFRYNSTDHPKNMFKDPEPGQWSEVENYFDVAGGDPITGEFTFYTNPLYSESGEFGYVLYDDISVTPGYKVTFDATEGEFDGGSKTNFVWSKDASYDTSAKAEPTREGYIFAGWATEAGGEVLDSVVSFDADVTYYAIWEDETSEPIGILGDVNNDGTIDGLDVLALMRISVSLDDPTELQSILSDVNGDDSIDGLDVLALARFVVMFDDGFGIGLTVGDN